VLRAVRAAAGPDFILIFRLSLLDLVEGGSTWDEVEAFAKAAEGTGINLLNTGIGWHEARIPTIMSSVPRAFSALSARLKKVVKLPVITSNRINDPRWRKTSWPAATPIWCPWPAPSWPMPRS
jgi:2,4-dienoyl-CoA reductase (NADPH2)